MNLQIDTQTKTIKLAESVNLKELEEVLTKLFPNNEWREYKLETNTIINNWSYPTIIYRDNWNYPYWRSSFWYSGSTAGNYNSANTLTSNTAIANTTGTYNVSVN